MKQFRWATSILLMLGIQFFFTGTALSVSVDQTIPLQTGWNAVFLEVEPSSPTPATVFSSILKDGSQNDNLLSVWMWNPNSGTVEFIQNPSEVTVPQEHYLTYIPGNALLSNLYAIHGNKAYLVNMTSPATLTVSGEPLPPKVSWTSNSFNLVGFHLDPDNLQTYVQYFSTSVALADQEIYVLRNGVWADGTLETMARGESFWVYCKGSSEFYGSTSVRLNQINAISYGQVLEQQEITIQNNAATQTITLELTNSDVVPSPPYPLYYYHFDTEANIAQWEILNAPLQLTVPSGGQQVVKLGVKRTELADDVSYKANLKVSDSAGSLFSVPVSVTGVSFAGLWVGDVTVRKVNQPANDIAPTPTGAPFTFRLILHNSASGTTVLMNQVLQMWQEGTWKTDPDDLSKQIVDQPGSFVLFSDDALIPFYSGASLRDGQPVGRRISSPVFGNLYAEDEFPTVTRVNHKQMSGGSFAAEDATLAIKLLLPADDPDNPFVHRYHSMHGIPNGETPTEDTFNITRDIQLTFSDTDVDGDPLLGNTQLGWGTSTLGGRYDETLKGLIYQEDQNLPGNIHLQGNFILHRVSSVDTLTTTAP